MLPARLLLKVAGEEQKKGRERKKSPSASIAPTADCEKALVKGGKTREGAILQSPIEGRKSTSKAAVTFSSTLNILFGKSNQ